MFLRKTKQAVVIVGLILSGSPCAVGAEPAGDPIDVTLSPIDLKFGDPSFKQIGVLTYVAGFQLTSNDAKFGGISGLSLRPDEGTLLAVIDTGLWFSARMIHGPDRVLRGLTGARIGTLVIESGRPVDKRTAKIDGDAEAVERLPDGGLLVSFERRHRILRYPSPAATPTGKPVQLSAPKGLQKVPSNSGFEALAPLPDGRLLALSENHRNSQGDRVGWLYDKERRKAKKLSLRKAGLLKPTDLAVLPTGDVLLLERSYTPLAGPGARISFIPAGAIKPKARLEPKLLAEFSLPLTVDNFEGLAIAMAPRGGWHLYLVSDDNFNPLQRTLLLQFHWRGMDK